VPAPAIFTAINPYARLQLTPPGIEDEIHEIHEIRGQQLWTTGIRKKVSLYSPAYWQALKALEPMIDSISHELIDRIEDRGEGKFLSEFGLLLPLTVIASQTGH